MRVLLDTTSLNPMSGGRGIGVYTDLLRKHLAYVQDVELSETQTGQPFDIVHYPFFDFFFHTLPFFKKTKTVVTIHDVIPLVFSKQYWPGFKGMLRSFQQRLSLSNVSAVITDSECSKQDIMQHLGVPEDHVHVVYLAGNPTIRRQALEVRTRVSLQYKLPGKFVLYVGDINYNKNIPRLIEACSQLPNDVHLVMVGRTLENTSIPEGRALQEALDGCNMWSRAHLLTNISKEKNDDLAAIFSLATVYMQPSIYEGFGLSLLDAMQCETLVVAANSSSLPEVGGKAVLYCDPYDVKDMTRVMLRAIEMKADEKRKMQELMRIQLQNFSWEKTANETAAVYRKVCAQ